MAKISVPTSFEARTSRRFLRELEHRLERLDRAILIAEWDLSTGRSTAGSESWNLKRSALLSDGRLLSWVRSTLRRGGPAPFLRKLELLERILLDAQVEQHPDVVRPRSELQRRVARFRPRWNGRRVDRAVVSRALRESPKAGERRRAFYALEELHRPMEEGLRALVRSRNELARALGFRSFAAMRLGFDGLTPSRLQELAEEAVGPARRRVRAVRDRFEDATGQRDWGPWDLEFAREQRVPLPDRSFPRKTMVPRIFRAIDAWGLHPARMGFRVVFHDVPSGGLTLAPDPPKDIRVVVHPTDGWLAYAIMFHEFGHAVHSARMRAPRHLLRWHENIPGFGPFHEGIGTLFENIPSQEAWLAGQPGIGPRLAHDFAEGARADGAIDAGRHASWLLVEQLLYRHPERDPIAEAVRFERRVFGYDPYAPLSFVDPFFIDLPIYASNYLLAMLFDAQLEERMAEVCGRPFWPNRKVGAWLTNEWFASGSLYDWLPRLREVTGRPFGSRAFLRRFREGAASA